MGHSIPTSIELPSSEKDGCYWEGVVAREGEGIRVEDGTPNTVARATSEATCTAVVGPGTGHSSGEGLVEEETWERGRGSIS